MILANFDEAKQSQLPMVELLLNMGYNYISRSEVLKMRGGDLSKFILKDIAVEKLYEINSYTFKDQQYKFSRKNVEQVISELETIPLEGLIDTSKEIYGTIMSGAGKTIKEFVDGKMESFSFKFIDFENISNNHFGVAVEYEAEGKGAIRVDIVLFVNGIPFVTIENKKSSVDVMEAVKQLNRNQNSDFCPKFFVYPQLLIATNKDKFLYGTTGTPAKFYAPWKEKDFSTPQLEQKVQDLITKPIETETYKQLCTDLNGAIGSKHNQILERKTSDQDLGTVCMLEPERLLEIAKNNIVYDATGKIVSRYQQFFGIQKMLTRISELEETSTGLKRKGGIMWHTQGSGKSLTMVMFVKALIEDKSILNPRIIIVTDRKDLDKQIKGTFESCKLKKEVIQAKSGSNLLSLIKNKTPKVVTTLVQKFESAKRQFTYFTDESKDIFILIDEAHRTQGGMANVEMRRLIPNACFIGFTGTPLMKKEKNSAMQFGGYIDKYTLDDALADGIILPLIYEGRYVEMEQNKELIDKHIERMPLNQEQTKKLQKEISTKIIKSNPQRINEIAYDITLHFTDNFSGKGLKAQIVAPSKYSAILFQKYFETQGFINTAVVISDTPIDPNEENEHKKEVSSFIKSITDRYKSLESYEIDMINSFKKDEEGIEILIVVDKLLTGFDAPRNTVLYLTKDLKDHNLLQAIARVNRLCEDGKIPKTCGYIIDYSANAKNLKDAMELFGNFEDGDVAHTLINVSEKIQELETGYDRLHEVFKDLKETFDDQAYLDKMVDETDRKVFYSAFGEFVKVFNECLVIPNFVKEFDHLDTYKKELMKFSNIQKSVRLKYADNDDFSLYRQSLIKILDKYVDAKQVELMTSQVNINDKEAFDKAIDSFGSDKSKAEAIASQTQKTITEKEKTDPEFYKRFSDKIDQVLKLMKEGKIADLEALQQMHKFRDQVINKTDDRTPEKLKNVAGGGLIYRNLKSEFTSLGVISELNFIDIVDAVCKIIQDQAIVDWFKNSEIKRIIKNKIDDYLYDQLHLNQGINVDSTKVQELIEKIIALSVENNQSFNHD